MDQLREIWDYMERQTESAYQICTAQMEKDLHPCRGISPTGTADPEMILRKALALVAEHEKIWSRFM